MLILLSGEMARAASIELPAWINDVGARSAPKGEKVFAVDAFGGKNDGKTDCTEAIQKAIDACAQGGGGRVTFAPGTYLTGAIFIKSHVDFVVGEGVTLLGTQEEKAYPRRASRIAGIEMEWPAALINVDGQEDVKISGAGTIDGNGEVWWNKYWTLRKDYEKRGLRWAADYDAERARLLVVYKSSDVTLEGVRLRRAGFWTVQVCYSEHVTVDGINIRDNGGPSTDGVDIDSSSRVLVQKCDIDNNDDCICLKAGRDFDGLRVNRPTEYVVIRDNITRKGGGIISFGSETSGGIRHVVAYRNAGIGTTEGVRFKSAKTRGGIVEDVLVRDLKMEHVPMPFTFTLNWNPSYSYSKIPPGMEKVPEYWKVINTPVEPPERGWCEFRNIVLANIEVSGAKRILTASGMQGRFVHDVHWENVTAHGAEAGSIEYARDWTMMNVKFFTPSGEAVKVTKSERVVVPEVGKEEGKR